MNVHYLSTRAPEMAWEPREEAVQTVLREIDADIIALQEVESFGGGAFSRENVQLVSVLEALPDHAAAAVGDPKLYPSTQPILYRESLLEPLSQGFFFFSPTPDAIYSRPWHKRFPAFASFVRFRHRDAGLTFYVFNLHADASSPRNRIKTARLVRERMEARAHPGDPVILLGDFNAPSWFPALGIYLRAGFTRAPVRGSTFHFNRGLHLVPGIDHILVDDGFQVSPAIIVRSQPGGTWPSDHYPVIASVSRP